MLSNVEADSGNFEDAIAAANRAIELSPGSADVNAIAGRALYLSGEAQRGMEHMLIGMRLEPDFPEWLPGELYPALIEAGRFDKAISLARSVLMSDDIRDAYAQPKARIFITAAYTLKGDMINARKAVATMQRIMPDVTVELLMLWLPSMSDRPLRQVLYDAFVAAGVPRAAE